MTLTHNTEHVSEALELLIEQFKHKDDTEALLASYVRQVQLLEDAAFETMTGRWIDNATGEQLDFLGRLVGQERLGMTDDEYRPLVRARIRLNIGSGTAEDLLAIAAISNADAELVEQYPAAFVMHILDFGDSTALVGLLLGQKPGGVRGLVEWRAVERTFTFCDVADYPLTSATVGFGDVADPTIGGAFASVSEMIS